MPLSTHPDAVFDVSVSLGPLLSSKAWGCSAHYLRGAVTGIGIATAAASVLVSSEHTWHSILFLIVAGIADSYDTVPRPTSACLLGGGGSSLRLLLLTGCIKHRTNTLLGPPQFLLWLRQGHPGSRLRAS